MKKKNHQNQGFSLVEVTVAMAIAAIALITFVGFLPSAMKDIGNSSDRSALGTLYEDVHNRLEGVVLEEQELGIFYYDKRGVFVDPDATVINIEEENYFRVNAALKKSTTTSRMIDHGDFGEDSNGETIYAVVVDVFWPLTSTGEPINSTPSDSITYFTSAKSGYNWIDYGHEPKIEY